MVLPINYFDFVFILFGPCGLAIKNQLGDLWVPSLDLDSGALINVSPFDRGFTL